MDESGVTRSRVVWTLRWPADEAIRLLRSRYGCVRGLYGYDLPTLEKSGLTYLQVLSGKPPFWEITNKGAVIYAIMEGVRPEKPEEAESLGFTEGLWEVAQRCWLPNPSARPDVRNVLSHLNHATWSWERRRLV